MAYTRANGGAAILLAAAQQIGKPYSQRNPPGSAGDGHYWLPGEPTPTAFDCSGLTHYATALVGCAITVGNAQDQWEQSLGGRVPMNEPLLPGDIGAFMGAENIRNYAGHTAIVQSFNATTQLGTLVNAYNTRRGVCALPFNRLQLTNGSNGLGVIGFYRPANVLPAPPPPPAPIILGEDDMFIVDNPHNTGQCLVHGDKWAGIPNPVALSALEAQNIKILKLTQAQFDSLVPVLWGQV